jgi:hypothetical protein
MPTGRRKGAALMGPRSAPLPRPAHVPACQHPAASPRACPPVAVSWSCPSADTPSRTMVSGPATTGEYRGDPRVLRLAPSFTLCARATAPVRHPLGCVRSEPDGRVGPRPLRAAKRLKARALSQGRAASPARLFDPAFAAARPRSRADLRPWAVPSRRFGKTAPDGRADTGSVHPGRNGEGSRS